MEVLSNIFFEEPDGEIYYDILNSQGKEWLIGSKDIRTAFEIYQPTAIKGKILKSFFPCICRFPFVYSRLHIKKKKLKLQPEIEHILQRTFGNDVSISCFGGTPCVHQKAVIHTVRLPLRVNWGGGWSDTPPYCNEKGGTVLNAAILLNGEKPVEVTLERIPEQKVVFDSRDMDVHGEFDTIEPLQATGDPYDPFALQKACLLACGIIPREGHTLGEILERLGSGFVMHSEVTNVPKGSGLGTSPILSAACVKAVFEFMGIAYTEEDLYAHVLAMEQIMSTGGGWQEQVGGITSGLKYITSMPGLQQRLQVAHIELSPQTKKELDERFVLIYTGQRRLARNLLRDVVGRYVGNEPDSLFALEEIQKTAVLIDCCTIILIPVSLKCGDTGVIYRLSFLSIRQRLSRWRLIRSRNTIVERTEEIPSATGSAKKAAFAPKKEGRTAALITKRDFLVTESASPVFGHSRAVSPSTKTYWKLSGMIISV